MKVLIYNWSQFNSDASTANGLYMLAKTTMQFTASGIIANINELPSGFSPTGTTVGVDDEAILSPTPDFFPFATKGAEAAAKTTDLSWFELNMIDYEVVTYSISTTKYYLGFGVMNSSKTEFNDPFDTTKYGLSIAACWAGTSSPNFIQ